MQSSPITNVAVRIDKPVYTNTNVQFKWTYSQPLPAVRRDHVFKNTLNYTNSNVHEKTWGIYKCIKIYIRHFWTLLLHIDILCFCFTELKGLLCVFSEDVAVQHSWGKGVAENTRKALTNIDVSLPSVQIVRAWKHCSAKNRDQTAGGKHFVVVT